MVRSGCCVVTGNRCCAISRLAWQSRMHWFCLDCWEKSRGGGRCGKRSKCTMRCGGHERISWSRPAGTHDVCTSFRKKALATMWTRCGRTWMGGWGGCGIWIWRSTWMKRRGYIEMQVIESMICQAQQLAFTWRSRITPRTSILEGKTNIGTIMLYTPYTFSR
ncbi:hypothetical protein VTN96DRAFT_5712 [Rasamsonia emersonii]